MEHNLSGVRALVIGGTGFVGSRLVERLVEEGARVRVMVRNFGSAARIARFSVEMVSGDVTAPEAVASAIEGCDIVFHCAYGNVGDGHAQRRVTVGGTENVMAAALNAKVRRVIYLSTLSVYGVPPDGDLDEKAPRRRSGGHYADTKLDAENVAQRYGRERGLPLVILQPTIIYGPFGPLWTTEVLARLKRGGVTLIDGGAGLCNVVYIDDVVAAMLLAATKREAEGETFLISGQQPVTWREFYEGYARMLKGTAATVSLSASEAVRHYKRQRRNGRVFRQIENILREDESLRSRLLAAPEMRMLFRTTRSLMPSAVWGALKRRVKGGNGHAEWPQITTGPGRAAPEVVAPLDVRLQSSKVHVRIDKAKRLLGYQPAYDFESGLRATEQWARWANLLDD